MKKILFVDRDGTIIREPADQQIDSLAKLELLPDVIPSLLRLQDAGYRLVMVTNQDGLGTASFPQKDFDVAHHALMKILTSQGIRFDEVLICPHLPEAKCFCRKPNVGLVRHFLAGDMDPARSFVIGDRDTDVKLGENMGIGARRMGEWKTITRDLLDRPRRAQVVRVTKETTIDVTVSLDEPETAVSTGIGFFDHMLEQIARHSGIGLKIKTTGDLHIDEHHSVEDTAIALGKALAQDSLTVPLSAILPLLTIATSRQNSSTSTSRCELMKIVTPCSSSTLRISRMWRRPTGSTPSEGSSRISSVGA